MTLWLEIMLVLSNASDIGNNPQGDSMIHSGKCQQCKTTVNRANAEPIEIKVGKEKYKGISYFCPSCHSVLSVSMDPLGLNQNLVIRLMKALGRG